MDSLHYQELENILLDSNLTNLQKFELIKFMDRYAESYHRSRVEDEDLQPSNQDKKFHCRNRGDTSNPICQEQCILCVMDCQD